MGFLIAILVLVLIGLIVLVVGAPLRRARSGSGLQAASAAADAAAPDADRPVAPVSHVELLEHDELEAAREAKYREIRDAELDFRTGKLSREDYQRIDADLRAEAIAILDRLERLRPRDA